LFVVLRSKLWNARKEYDRRARNAIQELACRLTERPRERFNCLECRQSYHCWSATIIHLHSIKITI